MGDSNRPRGECQHGQLARKCELCEKDATITEQAATIARLEASDAECGMWESRALHWRKQFEHAEAECAALRARVAELEKPGMAYERYRLSLPICTGCGERHQSYVMCPPHEVRSSRKEQP